MTGIRSTSRRDTHFNWGSPRTVQMRTSGLFLMLIKVHLSAFLTLGEPGPPGHDASRSSLAGPAASSRAAKPPRGSALPVVRARVELRRESAKKTPAIIFVVCPWKI